MPVSRQRLCVNLVHVLFGVYIWETFTSFDFEWMLFYGKKKCRWPLVLYVLNRCCTCTALIVTLFVISNGQAHCREAFRAMDFLTHLALVLASLTLAIRALAVWSWNKMIMVSIVSFVVARLSVCIYHTLAIKINDVPGVGCVMPGQVDPSRTAIYIAAVVFDWAILSLTVYKLKMRMRAISLVPVNKCSCLRILLFKQGMIYFVLAFLTNLFVVILSNLHLDMNILLGAASCSAVVCSIAAGRLARWLYNNDCNQQLIISVNSLRTLPTAPLSRIKDNMDATLT
ncbi:hypothetical protein CPB83DRAFT_893805 [Crepidotus variabilis]|uniref:Uncharacterized protein n=1 Tax=Crepidotus variabilis TaxID=179855 RepID=A0A9P6JQR2_9AGAR|nr:hypothetical protein CPB83DRAFT_893805 [Crepidotus variabilis]